ncbi:MAG: lipoate-protein ligase B [Rhodobacteraceae bacterium]|nr:lipoate-protein ligase B [Paracoccaceae bacterium]
MVEWRVTPGLTDYEEAVRVMEQRAEDIAAGRADELLWFVEHPPLNLNERGRDVRCFVRQLEKWVIDTLDQFNITGFIRDGRVGVWVERPDKPKTITNKTAEDKIAAIGIRLRKWVSFHGISINVDPNLDHFDGIVPCGITEFGVTSLVDLGLPVSMFDLDVALKQSFVRVFESDSGQTCENAP